MVEDGAAGTQSGYVAHAAGATPEAVLTSGNNLALNEAVVAHCRAGSGGGDGRADRAGVARSGGRDFAAADAPDAAQSGLFLPLLKDAVFEGVQGLKVLVIDGDLRVHQQLEQINVIADAR